MVKKVLFVCNLNSVRSPMAAAILASGRASEVIVDSAGVYEGGADPFVAKVLEEIGVPLGDYEPKALSDVDVSRFDLVIALTPEAAAETRRLLPASRIEFWPTDNPSDVRGGDDALFSAYRSVRDELAARIRARFPAGKKQP
ncbi:MAG: low molecular weight phosphatase family protein [Parvularculaceae bacterium]